MCNGKSDSYEDRFVLCCIGYSRAGHDIRTHPQPEIENVIPQILTRIPPLNCIFIVYLKFILFVVFLLFTFLSHV